MVFNAIQCIISGTICLTGIIALIFSIKTYKHKDNVNLYFSNEEDPKFIKSKRIVYSLDENLHSDLKIKGKKVSDDEINKAISHIINNYHHYGLLLKHKYIPKWVFYSKSDGLTSSSISIIKMYKKLKPYIEKRHGENNPKYANYFDYLISELKRNCPKEFEMYYLIHK